MSNFFFSYNKIYYKNSIINKKNLNLYINFNLKPLFLFWKYFVYINIFLINSSSYFLFNNNIRGYLNFVKIKLKILKC